MNTTALSFGGTVLGGLTEDERAAIERELWNVRTFLDRVCGAEDDLIDDYLSNRLAAEEHERFERHYLASARAIARAWPSRAR